MQSRCEIEAPTSKREVHKASTSRGFAAAPGTCTEEAVFGAGTWSESSCQGALYHPSSKFTSLDFKPLPPEQVDPPASAPGFLPFFESFPPLCILLWPWLRRALIFWSICCWSIELHLFLLLVRKVLQLRQHQLEPTRIDEPSVPNLRGGTWLWNE